MTQEIPLNIKDLAAAIGRSRSYVEAMRQAGYQFTHANRSLASDALRWLRRNPEFRSTSYRWGKKGASKRLPRPQPVAAGNSDAQVHSND